MTGQEQVQFHVMLGRKKHAVKPVVCTEAHQSPQACRLDKQGFLSKTSWIRQAVAPLGAWQSRGARPDTSASVFLESHLHAVQEEPPISRAGRLDRSCLLSGFKVVDEEGVPAATAVAEGGHLLGACLLRGHNRMGARTIPALQAEWTTFGHWILQCLTATAAA